MLKSIDMQSVSERASLGSDIAMAHEAYDRALAEEWVCDERKIMWGGVIRNGEYSRLNLVNEGGPSTQLDVFPMSGDLVRLEPKSDSLQFVRRRDQEDGVSLIVYSRDVGCCILRTFTEPQD